MRLKTLICLCCLLASWAWPPPRPALAEPPAYVPGEVLVKYRSLPRAASLPSAEGKRPGGKLRRVELASGERVDEATRRLEQDPDVEYAEPNYVISAEDVQADDPYFVSGDLWGLDFIDLPAAWGLTVGSSGVVVAVVDTGAALSHPDLAANIWTNPGEHADGLDDDGNGYVDDLHGFDFYNGDPDPTDDNGHGSLVAGIIGAVGNNGLGTVGVNWAVRIMPLKVMAADASGTVADAIEAIQYALENGAQVINVSWGLSNYSQALYDAIAQAQSRGVLVVASAGNSGENTDQSPHYPSGYSLPNIISVAATDYRSAALRSDSNWGPKSVDVAAPGSFLLSTSDGGSYKYGSGTSYAAAMVSGVAALVLSVPAYQDIDLAELTSRLIDSADPAPELAGLLVSGGVVDAYGALNILAPHQATLEPQQAITFHAPLGNDQYDWEIDGPQLGQIETGRFVAQSPGSCRIRAIPRAGSQAEALLSGFIEVVGEGAPETGEPSSGGEGAGGGGGGGGCFVATAAYGSLYEGHVRALRHFRDRFLLTSAPGRVFVRGYYSLSPPLAHFIAGRDSLRAMVRLSLLPLVAASEAALGGGPWRAMALGLLLALAGAAAIPPRLKGSGRT